MSDALYRAIFENSPLAMLLADDSRRYVEANPSACQLLGLERAELLSLRIDDILAEPNEPALLDESWSEFLRVGRMSSELVLQRRDGLPLTVSFTAQANVSPGLHLSVLVDVTAHKALERRITEARDQLYATAELGREQVTRLQTVTAALARARTLEEVAQVIVHEGCTAFDASRGVVAVMVEAGTMIEIVSVRGEAHEQLVPGQRHALTFHSPLTLAMRTLNPQIFETAPLLQAEFPELYDKYWSDFGALLALPMALHKQALGAMSLSYPGPRSFSTDEQNTLLAFARLCAQALERARLFDVAQAERRRAEQANRVKDEFLAVVSHELRTPLHAMLGWAALARSGRVVGPALERALTTIERNAHAQAKLVEDLLDITRISSGKMRLNIERTSPARVIEAALDVVRTAAEAKGVLLSAELEAEGTIAADPDRLQQVVWNLLSNAVKFTDRGGSVRVLLTTGEKDVRIVVEDSGQGIEPSFLPHLYERFRQAETSKRGRLGLGLGLSVVRHLVELHGGTIEAESEGLGHGSRFTVTLPSTATSRALPDGASKKRVLDAVSEWVAPEQLSGLSALVIDDELGSRELLGSLLESCQMQVQLASSAAEGMRMLGLARPDVIVSDIEMPEQDGYSFIEQVRRLPRESGGATPAVALTAHAKWEDRTRSLLSGFDMHVSKPVAPAELLAVIANLASGRRQSAS